MSNIWFTSDYHVGHEKILKLGSGRPFSSLEEMHDAIADRHNALVRPGDTVYNLGDFALKITHEEAYKFRQRLVGQQHFVYGNHDKVAKRMIKQYPNCFSSVNDLLIIKPGRGLPKITLCHYALRVWPGSYAGTWSLYGHSHGMLAEDHWLSFDVGVDAWNYTPVSIEQVAQKMKAKMSIWSSWKSNLPERKAE